MARKAKSSITRNRNYSTENEDDTKFYIKFKDPRSKSQIFYYFNEEDIFDPCIPLNQGDIVNDSTAVNIVEQPKPVGKTSARKDSPLAPPKPKTQRTTLPYFEESTLQVQTANFIPQPPPKAKQTPKKIPGFDDSFEDVGYMTAMDLGTVPDDEENVTAKQTLFEILEDEDKEEEEEEEEYHELEEIVEPVKVAPKNILQMRTAIESIDSADEKDFLKPISLSKEEFDKNNGNKDSPEYKKWAEAHLSKNTALARQISPAEFRLLKKLIGLKMK